MYSDDSGTLKGILASLLNSDQAIRWNEVGFATFYALLLASLGSYAHTYSMHMRLFRWIKATKRSGDEDQWEYLLNSEDTEWVYVRDHRYGLVYFGEVRGYSDSETRRELILVEVQVFDDTVKEGDRKLYEVPLLYICRDYNEISIEYPAIEKSNDKEDMPDA